MGSGASAGAGGGPLRTSIALVVILFLAPLALSAPAASATSFTVTATNFAWTPATLSVQPGDTITFVNGAGTHNWRLASGGATCALPCTKSFASEGAVAYICAIHPSMKGTLLVGTPPTVGISTPDPGGIVSGLVAIEGTASDPTHAISKVEVKVTGTTPSTAFALATLVGSGTSVGWTYSWATAAKLDGAYTITVRATDASGLFAETTRTIALDNPDTRELSVSALSHRLENAMTQTTISFSVANAGNTASGAFSVGFEYFYQGNWHAFATRPFAVPAFGNQLGSFVWNTPATLVGRFEVRATADSDGVVVETDETNNVRTALVNRINGAIAGVDAADPT